MGPLLIAAGRRQGEGGRRFGSESVARNPKAVQCARAQQTTVVLRDSRRNRVRHFYIGEHFLFSLLELFWERECRIDC